MVDYVDIDYTGYQVYRKSTSDMAHFLRSSLNSWGTKKQDLMFLSPTEAKYVVISTWCAQLL